MSFIGSWIGGVAGYLSGFVYAPTTELPQTPTFQQSNLSDTHISLTPHSMSPNYTPESMLDVELGEHDDDEVCDGSDSNV